MKDDLRAFLKEHIDCLSVELKVVAVDVGYGMNEHTEHILVATCKHGKYKIELVDE